MSTTAARAAIDAMVLAFNPHQRRGPDGKWVKVGGFTPSSRVKVPEARPFKASNWRTAGMSVIFDDGWPSHDDIEDRAVGFWQKRFTNQQGIRQVFRNMAAGKTGDDLYDGVDRDSFMHMGARVYDSKDPDADQPPYFDQADLEADLSNAAGWLHMQLADAPMTTQPLYRGLRMKKGELPSVGDEWDSDIVSWAEDRDWASYYAGIPEDKELGRVGDIEVVLRLSGPKRSVDLGPDALDEHITQGRYRVTRVTGTGRRRFVTVEEVR